MSDLSNELNGLECVPLNPDFKKRWVEALRSGKYTQGKYHLCQEEKNSEGVIGLTHCCLGVACEIQEGVERHKNLEGDIYYALDDGERMSASLDYPMRKKINLDPFIMDVLSKVNDSGTPFSEIADWIEKNL